VALILVIDDDSFYRSVIRRILEDAGHAVVEADDGIEGIECYRQRHPAVVITDIFMPGMDGSEVIRTLKEIGGQAGIIAVSGGGAFYDIDFLDMAKKLGADAILRKLDPKERVLDEIDRILQAQTDEAPPAAV
jgi:two-component system, chemotaxis family, sensor kinase CheA